MKHSLQFLLFDRAYIFGGNAKKQSRFLSETALFLLFVSCNPSAVQMLSELPTVSLTYVSGLYRLKCRDCWIRNMHLFALLFRALLQVTPQERLLQGKWWSSTFSWQSPFNYWTCSVREQVIYYFISFVSLSSFSSLEVIAPSFLICPLSNFIVTTTSLWSGSRSVTVPFPKSLWTTLSPTLNSASILLNRHQ